MLNNKYGKRNIKQNSKVKSQKTKKKNLKEKSIKFS